MSELANYETACRSMTDGELLEESTLAFREYRDAFRNLQAAIGRLTVVNGIRTERSPDMEAEIYPLQRQPEESRIEL